MLSRKERTSKHWHCFCVSLHHSQLLIHLHLPRLSTSYCHVRHILLCGLLASIVDRSADCHLTVSHRIKGKYILLCSMLLKAFWTWFLDVWLDWFCYSNIFSHENYCTFLKIPIWHCACSCHNDDFVLDHQMSWGFYPFEARHDFWYSLGSWQALHFGGQDLGRPKCHEFRGKPVCLPSNKHHDRGIVHWCCDGWV